jgi:tetratricopeptide (TPR) repeat protein
MKPIFFALCFVSFAFATPLPTQARDTISQGNLALVQALLSPERPFVDHPLWKEAIVFGLAAKQFAPAHPEPYGYLAKVYSYLSWYERAWVNYQSYQTLGGQLSLEQQAQIVELSKTLGYSLMTQGLYQEAHTYYLLGHNHAPNDPEIALQLARTYLALEKPGLAQVYLRQLEAREPGSEYGSYLELAQDQNTFGQAASQAFQQGVSAYYQGQNEVAFEMFKQALQANPNYRKAYVWAGRVGLELGRPSEALPYWQEASRLDPRDAGTAYFLDITQNQLRWGRDAYTAFQQAIKSNEQGNIAQAEQSLRQAVVYNPNYSEAWANLGYIAQQQNQLQKALESLAEACRLEPQNLSYQQAYQDVTKQLESQRALQQAKAEKVQATRKPAPALVSVAAPQVMMVMNQNQATPVVSETNSQAPTEVMISDRANLALLPYLNLGPVTGGAALTLLNVQHEHPLPATDDQSSIAFFTSPNDVRGDWFAPVNYANGTIYQRLEVLSKPSYETIYYQLCLVPNDDISIKPACSRASGLTLSDVGVYEFTQPLSSFYEYYNIDWSKGISNLMVIIRDKNGNPIDAVSVTAQGESLEGYFPMQVRYSVVLVPSGGEFRGW